MVCLKFCFEDRAVVFLQRKAFEKDLHENFLVLFLFLNSYWWNLRIVYLLKFLYCHLHDKIFDQSKLLRFWFVFPVVFQKHYQSIGYHCLLSQKNRLLWCYLDFQYQIILGQNFLGPKVLHCIQRKGNLFLMSFCE